MGFIALMRSISDYFRGITGLWEHYFAWAIDGGATNSVTVKRWRILVVSQLEFFLPGQSSFLTITQETMAPVM
jgi:hypothetical protein